MESKKNLKAIDIIKDSLKVFAKNSNFIFFIALISLPIFFFSLYFQNLFQNFLLQASQTLLEKTKTQKSPYRNLISSRTYSDITITKLTLESSITTQWSRPLLILRSLSNDQIHNLFHLGFLYLAPYNLLQLVTVVLVVDLASKLYREEKVLTFNDMLGIRFSRERLQGVLVTFLYVVAFSSCTLVGFIWLLLTYSAVLSYFPYGSDFYFGTYIAPFYTDNFFHLMTGFNLVLMVGMNLCWSAIWNLGLVISVLEERYGPRALGSSGYLCLRNVHNGMILMLVFSIWELGSRIPWWFSLGGYGSWGVIVAQSGLFCLGNALKWVAFVVYFDSCVKRVFVKKVDVEG